MNAKLVETSLLEAVLSSWDRNNLILLNLLHMLPPGGLSSKITETSRTVSEMFTHIHHERMVSVAEEAPELSPQVPEQEWYFESDPIQIATMLHNSAKLVRHAVESRVQQGRQLELNFAHPIHLVQLLIFHEGYHHGQIKSALKVAGFLLSDDVAGPLTWDVWRRRSLNIT